MGPAEEGWKESEYRREEGRGRKRKTRADRVVAGTEVGRQGRVQRGREPQPRPRPGEDRAPARPPYQPEQEAPEQGGRGGGQRSLRPHRTAGCPAARRGAARRGGGSGSGRCAASVAEPDRRVAGAAAVAGEASAAPTSFSGHARRTRKPPRGARGVPGPRAGPARLTHRCRRVWVCLFPGA